MANVLTVVWFVIAWSVAQAAIMVWAALMLPGPTQRARRLLETRPWRSLFTGLGFWLLSLAVMVGLIRNTPGGGQMVGWVSAVPTFALSVVGGAGFARLLADRIEQQAPSVSPLARLVGAGFCMSLAGVTPIIGWLVFLPITGWMCVGSGLMAVVSRQRHAAADGVPAAPPSPANTPQTIRSSRFGHLRRPTAGYASPAGDD